MSGPRRQLPERCSFVHGDMVGRVAFDLVLRLGRAGTDGVALELYLGRHDPGDMTADSTSFRVPTHVVAYVERSPCSQNRLLVASPTPQRMMEFAAQRLLSDP